jgi:hypothetical protein
VGKGKGNLPFERENCSPKGHPYTLNEGSKMEFPILAGGKRERGREGGKLPLVRDLRTSESHQASFLSQGNLQYRSFQSSLVDICD